MTMEERIGLVFSWDPQARNWVKERGPANAALPPAEPIDNEAVQTYFLDTQTGRWESTILGSRARQIAAELAGRYRAAMVVGLAILPQASARKTAVVPQPDKPRKGVPLMAGLAAIVVVIGAGAFVAQAMRPTDVNAALPTAAPIASALAATPTDPAASAEATAEATAPAATTAPDATPVRTAPARTPAPTAPPVIQTVTYSSRLPNGSTVSYVGPNGVIQGAALDGVLSLRVASGAPGSEQLTLYVGPLGSAQTVTLSPDVSGNFRFSLKVSSARGTVPMNFSLGKNGAIQTLGTIVVR
jgi:hypothetical protein